MLIYLLDEMIGIINRDLHEKNKIKPRAADEIPIIFHLIWIILQHWRLAMNFDTFGLSQWFSFIFYSFYCYLRQYSTANATPQKFILLASSRFTKKKTRFHCDKLISAGSTNVINFRNVNSNNNAFGMP